MVGLRSGRGTNRDFFEDQSNLSLDLNVGEAAVNAAKGRRVRTTSEDHNILLIEALGEGSQRVLSNCPVRLVSSSQFFAVTHTT
jgi:hypothetical protein